MNFNAIKHSKIGRFAILTSIEVLLYIFLTFIIWGFDGGISFWISFVFAVISIVLASFISYLSVSSARKMMDWVFSLPIIRWCILYVIIELVIATVFMIFNAHWKFAFIPQFLLPIFFLILVLPGFAQKSHVGAVREETTVKVGYIRQMNARLVVLIPRTEDPLLKQDLEKAADMLRHSDPMSAQSLAEVEQKMSVCVDEIDILIRDSNYTEAAPLVKEICLLIEERNQLVIASKLNQY